MDQLKRLRVERGLSQARLAARAELDPSTVNQIERGAREASPATLRKLADALDVSLVELLEVDSPKVQSPLPETDEERHHLIPLMDYNIMILSELSKGHKPFLANLSEDLPPSRALMVFQRVKEFMYTCDLLEHALDEEGVTDAAISLLGRAEMGESVPDDLLEKARAFQKAWTELFVEVWTSANNWVESQHKRPEVMEYSNQDRRETDERLARTTGVAHLDPRREAREKRSASTWGARAEGAG